MAKINQYPAKTVPSNNDVFVLHDPASGSTKKMTRGDLLGGAPLPANTVDTQSIVTGAVTSDKLGVVWNNWSPTIVGLTAAIPGSVYRYCKVGKTVTIMIRQPIDGTSNSTSFSMTLPFTSASISNAIWAGFCRATNAGTLAGTRYATINSGSNTVDFTTSPDASPTPWTNSGGKRVADCTLTYESAE